MSPAQPLESRQQVSSQKRVTFASSQLNKLKRLTSPSAQHQSFSATETKPFIIFRKQTNKVDQSRQEIDTYGFRCF